MHVIISSRNTVYVFDVYVVLFIQFNSHPKSLYLYNLNSFCRLFCHICLFPSPPPIFSQIQLLDFRDQYLPPPHSQAHTLILFFFFYRSMPPLSYTHTLFPKKTIPPNTNTLFFFKNQSSPIPQATSYTVFPDINPPPHTHTHHLPHCFFFTINTPLITESSQKLFTNILHILFLISCTPPPKSLMISRIIHRY